MIQRQGECAWLQVWGKHEGRRDQQSGDKLVAAALRNEFAMDWAEVLRIAGRPEYGNIKEVRTVVYETAKALGKRSPYDSHE
jgi:hypothetical protein